MTTRHILYLTNQQMTALVWKGHRAAEVKSFDTDEEGVVAFSQYLEQKAELGTYLLLDLIEEDFRLDTVPRVGRRDRDVILARRLQQIYRGTPFRAAQVQGREADGRRDWRVLYTAITNSDLLQPWIAALQAHRIPLVGIYSAPLLVTPLLKALRPLTRHSLIVSLHDTGGLRQNYVRDGFLRFSRMTPPGDTTPSLMPQFIAEETERTFQYLNSLNHFGPDEFLQVVVITDRSGESTLKPVLQSTSQLKYEYRNIPELASALGMREVPAGRNAAALYIHALAEHPPANHFASSELTRYAALRRVRLGLWAASAAVLLTCGATAAVDWVEGRNLAADTARNEASAARVRNDEAAVRRLFPPTRVRPDLMNATVAFYYNAVGNAPTLEDYVGKLSRVLPAFPDVRLVQLHWTLATDARAKPTFVEQRHDTGGRLQNTASTNRNAAQGQSAPSPAIPAPGAGYYQIAMIEGVVVGPAADYRHALNVLKSLEQAIERGMPGAKVEEVSMPINPGSQVGLQGRVDTEEGATEAHFVLKTVIGPRNATKPGDALSTASAGAMR